MGKAGLNTRFLRFLIVGGVGFLIDAGLVYGLSRLGMSPIFARIPAISMAILVTWVLNRKLTFAVENPASAGELTRYLGVALISALLNFAVYSALVVAGILPVDAVGIATIALMFFSFFGYKLFAFRAKH